MKNQFLLLLLLLFWFFCCCCFDFFYYLFCSILANKTVCDLCEKGTWTCVPFVAERDAKGPKTTALDWTAFSSESVKTASTWRQNDQGFLTVTATGSYSAEWEATHLILVRPRFIIHCFTFSWSGREAGLNSIVPWKRTKKKPIQTHVLLAASINHPLAFGNWRRVEETFPSLLWQQ